jgi:hypothetical protein
MLAELDRPAPLSHRLRIRLSFVVRNSHRSCKYVVV